MATNIEVSKNGTENNVSLLRRFSRRVKGSGILNRMRSLRYAKRNISEYTKKKQALKSLRRREEIAELIKLGKLVDKSNARGGRRK